MFGRLDLPMPQPSPHRLRLGVLEGLWLYFFRPHTQPSLCILMTQVLEPVWVSLSVVAFFVDLLRVLFVFASGSCISAGIV